MNLLDIRKLGWYLRTLCLTTLCITDLCKESCIVAPVIPDCVLDLSQEFNMSVSPKAVAGVVSRPLCDTVALTFEGQQVN